MIVTVEARQALAEIAWAEYRRRHAEISRHILRVFTEPDDFIARHSRDGIDWFDAPRPRPWHRCTPWTSAPWGGKIVQRCACGSIRNGTRGPWLERNSKSPRRRSP